VERHCRSRLERNSKQGKFDSRRMNRFTVGSLECVFSYKLIFKSNLKEWSSAIGVNPSEGGELDKSFNV